MTKQLNKSPNGKECRGLVYFKKKFKHCPKHFTPCTIPLQPHTGHDGMVDCLGVNSVREFGDVEIKNVPGGVFGLVWGAEKDLSLGSIVSSDFCL